MNVFLLNINFKQNKKTKNFFFQFFSNDTSKF